MKEIRPYLITGKEAEGRELSPLPDKERAFQEEWLQELLFKHPSILPISYLGDTYSPLISIGREIASIDNLFISPSGLLTIVETKLWRNPEAHRTVVAQILDYANTLSSWNYDQLQKTIDSFMLKRFGKSETIFNLAKHKSHNFDFNEIEFQDRVQDCLSNGRFALIIVGDRIFPQATQLADVIESAPHLHFSIGFVELRCYKLDKDSDWPLVVVPSFVAKTNEITRAVVRVIYEGKKPEVQVTTVKEVKTGTGSTSFDVFISSLPSTVKDIFNTYIERWIKAGYTVYWGKVGFTVRIPWKGKLTTIFDAYPYTASVIQEKRIRQAELPIEPYQRYKERLLTSTALGSVLSAGRIYRNFDELSTEDIQLLLNSTDILLQDFTSKQQ